MDYSAIGQAASESEDLTVERKTERAIPTEGVALLRLVDYIETGRHEAKNPQHKPSLKVLLTFELSHPAHMIEIEGKKVPARVTVRVNKTYSDKGKYIPLFKAMNRCFGNQYGHFVQMIDKPLLAEVFHNIWEGKTYANLHVDGAWSFKEPSMKDPIAGTSVPVPVPEMQGKPKVFLWESKGVSDAQIIEMWDGLFIEGTRTDNDGTEVSNNWIQETIQSNIEWEGSVIQALTEEFVNLEEPSNDSLESNAVPNLD